MEMNAAQPHHLRCCPDQVPCLRDTCFAFDCCQLGSAIFSFRITIAGGLAMSTQTK